MKTYLIAAIAALTLTPLAAFAGGTSDTVYEAEPVVYVAAPYDRGIELRFTTTGTSTDDLGDNWELRGGFEALSYSVAGGVSTLTFYGEFGAVNANEFGAVGAEYDWTTALSQATDLTLEADVAYVMFNDFNDGDVLVTPNANLTFYATDNLAVFGEVGYTWDATNDWTRQGGYTELGVDIAASDSISIVSSVIKPFDSIDDDVRGSLEVKFNL